MWRWPDGPGPAARSIQTEVLEGKGIRGDGKIDDYVHLDATHLGADVLGTKLPDITDFCKTYLGINPADKPMPVLPTAHYAMGGIPTDTDGRVLLDKDGETRYTWTRVVQLDSNRDS